MPSKKLHFSSIGSFHHEKKRKTNEYLLSPSDKFVMIWGQIGRRGEIAQIDRLGQVGQMEPKD